jgi:FkbM family methyltransferase
LKGTRFILGSAMGEGGGATIFFNRCEPLQISAFAKSLKPGQIFFDIGANIGLYTMLASRLVGSSGAVLAFEPEIRNISRLYRHIEINRSQNVSVLAAACSEASGLAAFTAGTNFATGHLDTTGSSGRPSDLPRKLVPTVTVDNVAERLGAVPDLIKIDVEGTELEVLHGAATILKAKHPQIFLSVHSDELRRTCLEYLASFGYTASTFDPDDPNPMEYLLV